MTRFANALNEHYEIDLPPTSFFNYSTVGELAGFLAVDHSEALLKQHSNGLAAPNKLTSRQIAIVDPVSPILSRQKRRAIVGPITTSSMP